MARTTLAATDVPGKFATDGVAVTWAAADAANGNQFVCTGREVLLARNTDASAHTVTVTSTADSAGRTGDITADSIAADAMHVYQEFPTVGWMQSNGYIYVDCDDVTVELAVLRLPA